MPIRRKTIKKKTLININKNFLSGDVIQYLCDHYLGFKEDFNPKNIYDPKTDKNKIIFLEDLSNSYENTFIIFMHTHTLKKLDIVLKGLKFFKNPFKLILHNSDENFEEKYLKLLEIKNLVEIFTQNINVISPRVNYLPIGFARHIWNHGNKSIINKHINSIGEKNKDIFFNFRISTNNDVRKKCYDIIKEKNIPWLKDEKFDNYLKNLKKYKFAINPEGNGIDCHRIWECLYLKVIPICKNNILSKEIKKLFPIVILEDWEDLDVLSLNYEDYSWENYDKLFLDYWKNIILNKTFDIVIPVGPKDKNIINEQITYTKKNIIGYRKIFLVMPKPLIKIEGCTSIDEDIFPFDKDYLKEKLFFTNRDQGYNWYLQQLIKLYSLFVIPDILENCLIIDSDTFFNKPTIFSENGLFLYNTSNEFHKPYFEHMKRLHPSFEKNIKESGICHHMIFEKKILKEIFKIVEDYHSKTFFKVFIDEVRFSFSGASEYELYFNYIIKNCSNLIKIRKLNWSNGNTFKDYDYISNHWYKR